MRSNSFANVAISFPTQGAKYSNLFLDWTQCSTSLDLIVLSCIFQPDYFQGAKISNLFLDPSGHHLLISLKSSEAEAGPSLYYLHSKWQQPKSVQSLDFPNNFEGRFAHHSFTLFLQTMQQVQRHSGVCSWVGSGPSRFPWLFNTAFVDWNKD